MPPPPPPPPEVPPLLRGRIGLGPGPGVGSGPGSGLGSAVTCDVDADVGDQVLALVELRAEAVVALVAALDREHDDQRRDERDRPDPDREQHVVGLRRRRGHDLRAGHEERLRGERVAARGERGLLELGDAAGAARDRRRHRRAARRGRRLAEVGDADDARHLADVEVVTAGRLGRDRARGARGERVGQAVVDGAVVVEPAVEHRARRRVVAVGPVAPRWRRRRRFAEHRDRR